MFAKSSLHKWHLPHLAYVWITNECQAPAMSSFMLADRNPTNTCKRTQLLKRHAKKAEA